VRAILPEAKQAGLVGLEVWHSSYNKGQEKIAATLVQDYGLLPSGGSDFHGANKPGIALNCCHVHAKVYYDLKK
jgi:predicted metal-dependent phosphoesterase TrpH